jgi:hypothetical protein
MLERIAKDCVMRNTSPLGLRLLSFLLVALLTTAPGCGAIATVAYWINGPTKVTAKFAGLEKKRVAVVCLDANSLGGPGGEADAIAKTTSIALGYHVPHVTMVRPAEIADWIDSRSEDLTDYRDVGRGVKADMVVGIDLDSFSIHDGQTLLKGRAKVGVKVYDMAKGGEVVYEVPVKEISWPENGSRSVTENEANFRTIFIHTLAQKIARDFYDYELLEDIAADAAHLAN